MPGLLSMKGPPSRIESGCLKLSTFTTVAPLSDNCLVVIGPAAAHMKSQTFSPSKIPLLTLPTPFAVR